MYSKIRDLNSIVFIVVDRFVVEIDMNMDAFRTSDQMRNKPNETRSELVSVSQIRRCILACMEIIFPCTPLLQKSIFAQPNLFTLT